MVTFKCIEDNCSQKDMAIDFLGEIAEAECGGCGITITSFDLRNDPELPTLI
jgi:hypothetical protein